MKQEITKMHMTGSMAQPANFIKVKSARFMEPVHWGPLGGNLVIQSTNKFAMHYSVLGLHIKLLVDGTSVIVPAANVRFVEEA